MSKCNFQIGLQNITLEEGGKNSTKKKSRVYFSIEDDTHLIGSWLKVQWIQLSVIVNQETIFG